MFICVGVYYSAIYIYGVEQNNACALFNTALYFVK